MAKRVRTVKGLIRHWQNLATTIERIPSASPKDHGVVMGLRAAAGDLREVMARAEKHHKASGDQA